MPNRPGRPKSQNPAVTRPTSGIRLDAEQEARIEAVHERLRKTFGATYSWSAAIRYLVDLGLQLDEAAQLEPGAKPAPKRIDVVTILEPWKGGLRASSETLKADTEELLRAAVNGQAVIQVPTDEMAPLYSAGGYAFVDTNTDTIASRDIVLAQVGGRLFVREYRESNGKVMLLPRDIASFDPILVEDVKAVKFLAKLAGPVRRR